MLVEKLFAIAAGFFEEKGVFVIGGMLNVGFVVVVVVVDISECECWAIESPWVKL